VGNPLRAPGAVPSTSYLLPARSYCGDYEDAPLILQAEAGKAGEPAAKP